MKFNAKSTSVRVCAAATLLTCLTGALTAKADDNKTDGNKAAASAQVSDSGKSSDNQSQASDSGKSSDSQAQGSDSSKSSDDGKSGKVVATPTPADGGKYAAAQSPADPMGLPIAGKVEVGGSTAASAAFNKDVLPAATEYIRKHLPESQNNSKFVAVNSLDLSKLTLATTHDVQATFVYEGAGYVNTLGVNTKGNGISGGNPEVIFPAVRSSDSAFASAPAGTRTAQDPLLPGDFVDLGRSIGEADMERIDQPLDERHIIRKPQRAVQMQRPRRDIVEDLGHDGLYRSHVLANGLPVLVLVRQPCGLEDQKPELPQLDPAIRDLLLNHLLVCQCFAPGNA